MAFFSSIGRLASVENRTSVLYDFSIVKKAKFYVFEGTETGGIGKTYAPTGEVLYAQLNPNSLNISTGTRNLHPKSAMAPGIKEDKPTDWSNMDDDLEISLRYDLYDEYMVGTADGFLQGWVSDRDLTSLTATSMQRLIELSRDDNQAVYFKWGSFEYFGKVKSANFTYTAFSRFGNPLKAEGSVGLASVGGVRDGQGKMKSFTESMEESAAAVAVMADDKVETGILKAEIFATQALR